MVFLAAVARLGVRGLAPGRMVPGRVLRGAKSRAGAKKAAAPRKPRASRKLAASATASEAEIAEMRAKETEPIPVQLGDEMELSFMKYAMSTILGRALPDMRDGLKPVHRRILYAMRELDLRPNSRYRKCARVVGEVLGKFHPHGDNSVYDALVRLAQDFVMSERLVDGHGNFGSVDADPAAAMRYTECKLTAFASDALLNADDLGKSNRDLPLDGGISVQLADNFDSSEQEPRVLPARLPVLLINGATGIAVGMATNIPPHNLGEVADAALAVARAAAKNESATDDELLEALPAPDFPTGGLIMGTAGVARAYATGQGSIVLRAKTHFEEKVRSGRAAIVATELPYQCVKSALLENTAALINAKKIEGIADIRDESGREGMRVVYELKANARPEVVLQSLFKATRLQLSFPANMVAIDHKIGGDVDDLAGIPVRFNLRDSLEKWLAFRFECVRRRAAHNERKAAARAHIVDGLVLATTHVDAVVALVRASPSPADARASLMAGAEAIPPLSEDQARAVLALTLGRLTSLEAGKLESEQAELAETLASLRAIRENDAVVYETICGEVVAIKKRFAEPRRTLIVSDDDAAAEGNADYAALPNERSAVLVARGNYVKRVGLSEFGAQTRGGRGRAGAAKDASVAHLVTCHDHDTLLCIANTGVAYGVRAYDVPAKSRTARGVPVPSVLPVEDDARIAGLLAVEADGFADDTFLVVLTKQGLVKRTPLKAFKDTTSRGLVALKLGDGDRVGWAKRCTDADDLVIVTKFGQLMRFKASSVRASGRTAMGVLAVKLRDGDAIAKMDVLAPDDTHVIVATADGVGKRIAVAELRVVKRGGLGVAAIKFKSEDDFVVGVAGCKENDEVMLVTEAGVVVRQEAFGISALSRAGKGTALQKIDAKDALIDVSVIPADLATDEAWDGDGDAAAK